MRENVRCYLERHGMSLLGRAVVSGLLVSGVVGIGAGSAASTHSEVGATAGTGVEVQDDPDDPDHHLHLDPSQPGSRRSHLQPHGDGRGERQPGHLLHRPVGRRHLQHLGCDRHLRRHRDLRRRRQPGRQRQLRGGDPGPAVLRRSRHPEHLLHVDPTEPGGRGRRLHPDGDGRGQRQPGDLLHRPVGHWHLHDLGCDCQLRRCRDLRRRRQPGRQRQLRGGDSGAAVLRSPRVPRRITFTSNPPNPAVVGGAYTPTAAGGASGNPVTFSIDPSATGTCTHLGRDRHLRRRRDLRDRRQPGRQRQLRGRDPGPAVLRSGPRLPDASPSRSTPPSPAVVGAHLHTTATGGACGNPVTFSIDPSAARHAAASRVRPSPSSPSGPASSTPTRPATPATTPRPRSSSPSPSARHPDASPSPRPRPPRRSWAAPTP